MDLKLDYFLPSYPLRDIVKSYYYIQSKNMVTTWQDSTATSRVAWVIPLHEGCIQKVLLDGKLYSFGTPYFQGIVLQKYQFEVSERNPLILVVEFKDLGFSRLFDIPASELHNMVIDATEIIPPYEMQSLLGYLYLVNDNKRQVAFIEDFLKSKLIKDTYLNLEKVRFASNVLRVGSSSIDKLSGQVSLSPRQFRRVFKEYIGISPKAFAKLSRFTRVYRGMLSRVKRQKWIEVAHECAYYDQMHLIKDFKMYTGYTPNNIPDEKYKMINDLLIRTSSTDGE